MSHHGTSFPGGSATDDPPLGRNPQLQVNTRKPGESVIVAIEIYLTSRTAFPGEVGPFEALVASGGFSSTSAFTSPNATWVPKFAVAHSEITAYSDGRWGYHEYSRWPQEFTRDAFHIHCIPSPPDRALKVRPEAINSALGRRPRAPRDAPGDILWLTWEPRDWTPVDCGVIGLGHLSAELEEEVVQEASKVIARFHRCAVKGGWSKIGEFLVVSLQHTLDRVRLLPAVIGVIIALAAQVQRLCLELWGLIRWLELVEHRVQEHLDCRTLVLPVLGAHTPNPSIAQVLHRAGIPVWFQQRITKEMVVHRVVEQTDLPSDFSRVPAFPRLLLAKRDLSGALNLPGEWRRAMHTVVFRQLCKSRLPGLFVDDGTDESPPAKRLREGAIFVGGDSASVGPAVPVLILRNASEVKALGHSLPVQPARAAAAAGSTKAKKSQPSRRVRARLKQAAADVVADVPRAPRHPFQNVHPSLNFYPSTILIEPRAWVMALNKAGPLSQPRSSVKYYFAPPWMLDSLAGYQPGGDRIFRYLLLSIRTFCRMRLLDHTVGGRPLNISEWRDALWGDYSSTTPGEGTSGASDARHKNRREQQLNIRSLFGKVNALPSYDAAMQPKYGKTVITADVLASDGGVRARIVWDAYETNWRCELLALDAVMTGSSEWSELDRWMRESLVSKVWGSGTSGIDITPDEECEPTFCWREPPEEGWKDCRPFLQAFVHMLGRWPGCPQFVEVQHCDEEVYIDVLETAVDFYVTTFVSKYDRLPVLPICPMHGAAF